MAWTSNSFKVTVRQTAKESAPQPVSNELREAMDDLATRAGNYADTRRKRVDSIQDVKLRESVQK